MTTTAIDIEAVRKRMDERRIRDINDLPEDGMSITDDGAFVRFPDGSWVSLDIESGWERGDEKIDVCTDALSAVPPFAFVTLGILTEDEYDAIRAFEKERDRQIAAADVERRRLRQEAEERATYERLRAKFEQV